MLLNRSYRKHTVAFILLAALTVIVGGCKKDVAVVPWDYEGCEVIPPFAPVGFGYTTTLIGSQLTWTDFNPSNPDEILYVDYWGGMDMYRYNYVTKEKELIYSGSQIFRPRWGSNDWILLNLPDNNVYKIKSNGDSLTQLTFTGFSFNPVWSLDADKFIYAYSDNGVFSSIIRSSDGTVLDTLNGGISSASSWQHDSLVAGAGMLVGYNNPEDGSYTNFLTLPNNAFAHGCQWVNDEIYYSYDEGIFKISPITAVNTLIKETCNAKRYFYPSYHPSNGKIMWVRQDRRYIDEYNLEVRYRIMMMNPDGSEETEIIIP